MTAFHASRRSVLQAGVLGPLGFGLSDLASLRARSAVVADTERGRRRSCVFLFLFGGPSHIDLWDMKPDAPEQVRGIFKPIATTVPGLHVCEHLPRLARVMNEICLLRSMTHRMNVHGPACSELFSGRPYHAAPTTDQASREDWPALSALVTRHDQTTGRLAPAVVLPWYVQFPGQPLRIAGQSGGRMGERYNAMLVDGDLERPDFAIAGLTLPTDVDGHRLAERRRLVTGMSDGLPESPARSAFERNSATVHRLLGERAGAAFDLNREPHSLRQRYGATAVGQSLLMARRLVEAGVGLVTVNWRDPTTIDGVNTCWDTHQNAFSKMTDLLCPMFDQAFPMFIEDLRERGLLETTLVVAVGEFGRTPRMGQFSQSSNTQKTGRDHWPHAFTALLAGGGVRGGQAYGATTSDGGFVADKPVTPADLAATILRHLGVDPKLTYEDEFQHVRRRLSDGAPIADLG